MDILLLNGPNLNMLGTREPAQYGTQTLEDIVARIGALATDAGLSIEHHQDNSEVGLIDKVHAASKNGTKYIIINPAAFTHTSIALRDAMLATGIAFTEVHLSNVYKREAFRQQSYFSDIAEGVISGFGAQGYEFALDAAITYIKEH
ncbi:type II 3-dehydroquinate dehydratase [bacterium endosymbiont of Bathymodiolus sp. 5 South]|jgi:3-dehydroquinate dehydratase-2|uniref:type II 3-dehydroquinate dehydratase n=1 Tax=bacterium endosymbiont of Bathymodiolus sp. 5 South TaxID=1181670 RepID=UPI0010BA9FB1|nr:type II 3-dehydroquinate dehydratase [bacterium endosymbiont of Bathymodiolus sp. 5 South]CAC9469010.1 3-dehydroquinate dehydratase II (EC 4.2.1.10) [uncultured Gammaproteobacteria bacterium]CAC9469126.1 3-dehydroquinate dehydratase II (EC 4.2.1.10) [uncultured Gammaproteobacteria bacterium]CAC9639389.1 3-dehydroquinate dehydratase II (EC 4.2.1.10) [uncultured Gammaproteobacteria bacterium]CAC9652556.1 3-dehydroquinate dehydratase II (EC 4.2.1.10) [uncultured Gammaproteobacteria bacterium]S